MWSLAERSKTLEGDTSKLEVNNAPHESLKINESSSVDDVKKWAEQFVETEDALKLKAQKINGKALRDLDALSLERWGIPGGPATILANEIIKLKGVAQDIFASFSSPEDKYHHLLSLLKKTTITLPSPLINPELQQKYLGPFNRRDVCLPFCESNIDMRLLGLTQQKPTEAASVVISRLNMLSSPTDRAHFAFVGMSGSAKTRSIFDISLEHWVMYIECVSPNQERFDLTEDRNFRAMVGTITKLPWEKPAEQKDNLNLTEQQIQIELLSRFLYLRGLFNIAKTVMPVDYLLGQINGGQDSIADIRCNLQSISSENCGILLRALSKDLQQYLGGRRIIIAIDEANVGLNKILYGHFKSPNGHNRGLLTPLSQAIVFHPSLSVSTLYAGTALTMLGGESIQSDIGKENKLIFITCFPGTHTGDPRKILDQELDLSNCDDVWEEPPQPENHSELVGRKRLLAGVISQISNLNKLEGTKSQLLRHAIKNCVKMHHAKLKCRLESALQEVPGLRSLLQWIVVANMIFNGNVVLPITDEMDLVNIGICQLIQSNNEYCWQLAEPLSVRVINDLLSLNPGKSVLEEARVALRRVIAERGPKSTEKGGYFEPLIAAEMMQWNNKTWAEIPVLHENATTLPSWMHQLHFSLKKFGTASMLGLKNDLEYVQKCASGEFEGVLLFPEKHMRPDGLMLVLRYIKPNSDKLYARSEVGDTTGLEKRWFAIVYSAKMYSNSVPLTTYLQSVSSTDLKKVYWHKDGSGVYIQSKYDEFNRLLGSDVFGTLRINVVLPRVQAMEPVPCEIVENDVVVTVTEDKNFSALFSPESLNILKYKIK